MSYILSILLFSFALLTDTHISTSNPRPMEDLQRSIADINQNPEIEFVVVTGDLTESGDRASIEAIKAGKSVKIQKGDFVAEVGSE